MDDQLAAGLLLTGGSSRRMGRDKAVMTVDGRRLADRAAEALSAVCRPVLEVGPGHTTLPAVREDPPGGGPLAALGAGWAALCARGWSGPVVVLAVDMPLVTADLLRFLARHPGRATVVPRSGGEPQPLCARYSPDALDLVPGLLAGGERSLRSLLAVIEVLWLEADDWAAAAPSDAFADLDAPEDADRLGLRIGFEVTKPHMWGVRDPKN